MNAMALIAPGAFLWLTFVTQATEGTTAPAMWLGILLALLLCLGHRGVLCGDGEAVSGPGQLVLLRRAVVPQPRQSVALCPALQVHRRLGIASLLLDLSGSHGGVTGIFCGYVVGTLWPNFMNASNPGPAFMMVVAIVFSFGVAYIAYRGVTGSTAVNIAINVIQITALVVFSVMALGYRMNHPPGSVALQFDSHTGAAYSYEFATTKTVGQRATTDTIVRDADGVPQCAKDASGKPVPYHIELSHQDSSGNFLSHASAKSVVGMHNCGWVFIQATVAILILVGFESVTSLGGEAKNAKRDIPIAVIMSLLVQGAFCYLFEYFAANYFLNSGYTMQNAAGSAAPIGDMMVMVGDALLGPGHGRIFMLCEAVTVFLALIGTTLSCMNTGARVTYAMGKDQEVPGTFRHAARQEPHAASRHLDAGDNLRRGRLPRRGDVFRRRLRSRGRRHPGFAARFLVQLRLLPHMTKWRPCPIRCSP